MAKFPCGHRRNAPNTDYRGGCRKCTNASAAHARKFANGRKPTTRKPVKLFEEIRPEVAAQIRALRGRFSQHRIAAEVGVSQSTVSRYLMQLAESDRPAPRFELVQVETRAESEAGRSYSVFPLKRRESAVAPYYGRSA